MNTIQFNLLFALYLSVSHGLKVIELNESHQMKCETVRVSDETVKYKINKRNVHIQYNCTESSNVIIVGKESGYGIINITSKGWNSLVNMEIRHVEKIFIEGGASSNKRRTIKISSCDELLSFKATHWGVNTIFDSIKKVLIEEIIGEPTINSIISFKNCNFENFTKLRGTFKHVEIIHTNIDVINKMDIKDAIIKMSGNTIRRINDDSIKLDLSNSYFNFKDNSVYSIAQNGITLDNLMAEIAHNKFYTLSANWMKLNGNTKIIMDSNIFYQQLEEVTFKTNDFCTFQDNSIHKISNKTCEKIYQYCLIENVFFELPCDCEMNDFPSTFKSESKCRVSTIEKTMCFDAKYISLEDYDKSWCKEYKYVTWSECGTKINTLIIGASIGIGIIVINIIICYIFKRNKTVETRENHKEAKNNNYDVTGPPKKDEQDRQSAEIIIDGLDPKLGHVIKVKSKVTNRLRLTSLPVNNGNQLACVMPTGCFPKHLENPDTSDYYSNDEAFKVKG